MKEGSNAFFVKSPVSPGNIYSEEELRFRGPAGRREFERWLSEGISQPTNPVEYVPHASYELTRNGNPRGVEIKRRCRHCGK